MTDDEQVEFTMFCQMVLDIMSDAQERCKKKFEEMKTPASDDTDMDQILQSYFITFVSKGWINIAEKIKQESIDHTGRELVLRMAEIFITDINQVGEILNMDAQDLIKAARSVNNIPSNFGRKTTNENSN